MRFTADNKDQIRHAAWLSITAWCEENEADSSAAMHAADLAAEDWLRRITERPQCQRDTALNYAIMHAIETCWPAGG
jgi:hypothetical protein